MPDDDTGLGDEPSWEELILGHPMTMGRRDVSRLAGVSQLSARKFWHALGFPRIADEGPFFTDADLVALRSVVRLVRDEDFTEEVALAMARAFARTADRLAVWQTQLMAEANTPGTLIGPKDEAVRTDPNAAHDIALRAAHQLAGLADDLEPLLVYAWRRHLVAAVHRLITDAAPDDPEGSWPRRAIGFADLVNFTSLVRRMTERELVRLVQRFEALTADIVTAHGGRVIKTVGDEVLFVHTEPAPAAAIALDLAEAMSEDDVLPEVRVGMAYGTVVSRLGDVFGTPVNRASRLMTIAPKGVVYVDDVLTTLLTVVSGFELTPTRRRNLRGVGPVTPAELRRSSSRRGGTHRRAENAQVAGPSPVHSLRSTP